MTKIPKMDSSLIDQRLKQSIVLNYDSEPTVSIIIPVRNEKEHIEKCLQSLIEQDYGQIAEILVVDGMSEDGTRGVIANFQSRCAKIKLIDNPRKIQTAALNMGISSARGQIIVRADAHAVYEHDYVTQCVVYLTATGAGNVGGPMRLTTYGSYVGSAIAFAHESKFGIGAARFHQASNEGWVDTVWLGAYWKSVFDDIGLYQEELVRTEDIDLNSRLRHHGYKVFLTPKIRAYYFPRRSLIDLWKQNFANGGGIIQTLHVNPKAISLRHLVPFLFVAGLLGSLFIAPFHMFGKALLGGIVALYFTLCMLFSLHIGWTQGLRYIPIIPIVFWTVHFSYGLGSVWGLFKFGLPTNILRRRATN